MIEKNNITGIILAGGKSSRMGSDKGFLKFDGKPFTQYAIDALKPFVNSILIVSDNPDYDVFNLKRIPDFIKNAGPLAGLYSGLNASKTQYNIVLSCDIPLINHNIIKILLNHINTKTDVVQLQSKNKKMPLIAAYKTSCKQKCLELLNQNERRLQIAVEQLKSKTVVLDKTLDNFTKNINTPSEFKHITNAVNH